MYFPDRFEKLPKIRERRNTSMLLTSPHRCTMRNASARFARCAIRPPLAQVKFRLHRRSFIFAATRCESLNANRLLILARFRVRLHSIDLSIYRTLRAISCLPRELCRAIRVKEDTNLTFIRFRGKHERFAGTIYSSKVRADPFPRVQLVLPVSLDINPGASPIISNREKSLPVSLDISF